MEYTFGLFDSHDQLIDETSIDENNEDLAWELFQDFAKTEGYERMNDPIAGYYVILLEEK
jgi:hypothetical protein